MYDYLVVGSGLFGATFARQMTDSGRSVLVIDKLDHVAGLAHTKVIAGTIVHIVGPHLFHTSSKEVWDFVHRFATFEPYQHRVKAIARGKIYSLPFNMLTFHQMWGCNTVAEAERILKERRQHYPNPRNLEEQALSVLGKEIYEHLIYGYTKKQWGVEPSELPASIIKRIRFRLNYDENYFDDPYQGVPEYGYTEMVLNMLEGIELRLNEDFHDLQNWRSIAAKLVYTGTIDHFFNYMFGPLAYRSPSFDHQVHSVDLYGAGQMNACDLEVPHTRTVEHRFFHRRRGKPVITYEQPTGGSLQGYPVNTEENQKRHQQYAQEALQYQDIIFGGRLGFYRYLNMDEVILAAMTLSKLELK